MIRSCPRAARLAVVAALPAIAWVMFGTRVAPAAKLTMQDGRVLDGRVGMVGGIAEKPDAAASKDAGGVDVAPILLLDDGLRRTFVSKRLVREVNEASQPATEKIKISQRVADAGHRIGGVGPILKITPFDEFGRRTFTMRSSEGPLDIIQGITEVTPVYTKVESLLPTGRKAYIWEMRIATSSIPRPILSKVLSRSINKNTANERLSIVRLYLQSERYQDAREELESIIKDFPDLQDLEAQVRSLRQMGSRRLLKEIEMRAEAGQHAYVMSLLEKFPTDDVAGETLQKVRELHERYQTRVAEGTETLKLLNETLESMQDKVLKYRAEKIRDEIAKELSFSTLDRLMAFRRLVDDDKLPADQKVAIAISGWLEGSDEAAENLATALSLYEVRGLIEQYLREPLAAERKEILEKLQSQPGGTVAEVAKLVRHMKPPIPTEPADEQHPGYYRLEIPSLDGAGVVYHVQLPPQYDPHRRYPAVVTLNGSGSTPEQQLDWWAGDRVAGGNRLGQATRHGYIVIAIEWLQDHQITYEFSAREHHAVLGSLRDAMRRFAIDSNRVFLSGHSIGGNAAWDIGLAHPDLWAGVIPVVAISDRYCAFYWENARYIPMYIIAGELDGDKMVRNARDLDRYLRRGYDTTVVEYLGRGHENFYDEIQRVFEWMNRKQRDFFPKEFTCASMRLWDNYFWWIEMGGIPEKSIVDPGSWPPPRGTRAATVSAKVSGGTIHVKSASSRVTVWLAPELIDFDKRMAVQVNGQRAGRDPFIRPDLEVLLEDVRTRGDRLRPFWARVDVPDDRQASK